VPSIPLLELDPPPLQAANANTRNNAAIQEHNFSDLIVLSPLIRSCKSDLLSRYGKEIRSLEKQIL
jgi:hypothetical protein